ncbi:MAG: translocation/assembly module TamB domain-containing protein [Calditrichia bacterium]
MKKNNWVFYFFILLFTAIISLQLVWRLSPIKSEIRESVQDKLRPVLGESFELDDFSLGFGFITFEDVQAGSPSEAYELQIEEIQIGYSIHKLLLHQLDPLQVIESITFTRPRLILRNDQQDTSKTGEGNGAGEVIGELDNFGEIDRIFITGGEVYIQPGAADTIRLMSGLEGFMYVPQGEAANFNLTGNLFSSPDRNMRLSGELDLQKKRWQGELQVSDYLVDEQFPFINSSKFTISQAKVHGRIFIEAASLQIGDLQLTGGLNVENMQASLFSQPLLLENYRIRFSGKTMLLQEVKGSVYDGHFILNGNLGTVFRPALNFNIDFKGYSAKYISISAPILELLNQGQISGKLEISGPPGNPVIEGQLNSPRLQYAIALFRDTRLDFRYHAGFWKFNKISARSIGLHHSGSGHINFNANTMALNLYSFRELGPGGIPLLDHLNNSHMQYFTRMSGDFPTLTFTGTIRNQFIREGDTLFSGSARYKLVDDQITVNSLSTSDSGLTLAARASNLWDQPTFDMIDLKNVPFNRLSSAAWVKFLDHYFGNEFYFSGPVNYPSIKANLLNRSSGEPVFTFSGNTINLIEPGLRLKARYSIATRPEEIRGSFFLQESDSSYQMQMEAPGVAAGQLTVGKTDDGIFSGSIQLDSLSAVNYLGSLPGAQQAVSQGGISGSAKFSGTAAAPQIEFNLEGRDFIINENGYYTAALQGAYRDNQLRLEKGRVDYNNRPILQTDFAWNSTEDHLNALFYGEDIESNFIATTVLNDPDLIEGRFSYKVQLNGTMMNPEINGTVSLQKGIIKEQKFHDLQIVFRDSIPPTAGIFEIQSHIFHIHNFYYEDAKGYSINGHGILPVSEEAPLDLMASAKGNILAELPGVLSFFRQADAIGEAQVHFTGSRSNLQLTAGSIRIEKGSIIFDSVIPPLENLRADIELLPEDNFVHINYVEGRLYDRDVKIYNVAQVPEELLLLEPWQFSDIGINFGILVLETDSRGIPLYIPGMMYPGDIGYFAVAGKTPSEKFYFAGPPEQPHIRGKITLYESRVTFPFLETDEAAAEEDNRVVDFLMNAHWDILATAGIGNRYFVDIPAVISQVYMDLNIDNVSQGLEFTGKLADETFRVEGSVESTRGRVEYLDMNFRVERFGAIFSRFELYPQVYGRAYTTVRDSTNFPKDIYLVLYAVDSETGQEVARSRWEDFRFKLVSSDPTIGETQEGVLAYLGYSVENISNKAGNVGLTLTENYLFRPLVRPLERKLERGLGLDYVRLRSNIASNLFYFSFQDRVKFTQGLNYNQPLVNNSFDPALLLLQSSEITLGKYLLKDIYLTYSGQLVSIYDESKLGLNHRLGLEYRLLRNLLLELEYDKFQFNPEFYNRDALNDFKIRLRHSFNF